MGHCFKFSNAPGIFFFSRWIIPGRRGSTAGSRPFPPAVLLAGAEGFEPPLAVLETAGLPLNLRPWVPAIPSLLDFLMHLVLTALRAEFLHLQPLRRRLFVLFFRLIAL